MKMTFLQRAVKSGYESHILSIYLFLSSSLYFFVTCVDTIPPFQWHILSRHLYYNNMSCHSHPGNAPPRCRWQSFEECRRVGTSCILSIPLSLSSGHCLPAPSSERPRMWSCNYWRSYLLLLLRERERERDRETAEKERVGRKLFIGVLPLHYNSHLLESKSPTKRDKESQACC